MANRQLKKVLMEVGHEFGSGREEEIKKELTMKLGEFADKVKRFGELGKKLYEVGNLNEIAEELSQIAENAEAYCMQETGGENGEGWFDQVTVKRNMNELKKYVGDFRKLAKEAHGLNQRMTALYEDSGRVLGRYFEIMDLDDQPHEPSEEEKIAKNASTGLSNVTENATCEHCGGKMNTDGTCEGCGMPMNECPCEKEELTEADKWIQKAVDPAHKGYCTPMTKSTCTPRRKALAQRFKKGIEEGTKCSVCGKPTKENTEGNPKYCQGHSQAEIQKLNKQGMKESMKLTHLMEDVNDDRPKDDWMKLSVPKLRYEQGKQFESDLKKKGFTILRKDWKERTGYQTEFCEFFTPKAEFNECNEYAVKTYKGYDTGDE